MAGDIGIGEVMTSVWLNKRAVIFTSFKPIIKMAAVAGAGAFFAKKGLLTPEACKANASMIMNFLLPLLIFETVLPAFDSKNMASVLSVVITGSFYQVMGFVFGLIVRWITPIPASWKGGVLAAGAFSNVGDLLIAYISTLAKSAPFNPDTDIALGTAYASIFMVVQMIAIFNLGGYQLIKRDFDPSRESLPDPEKSTTPKLIPEPSSFSPEKLVSRFTRKPQPCVKKPSSGTDIPEAIITPPTGDITRVNSPDVISHHKDAIKRVDTENSIPAPSITTAPTLSRRMWTLIQPFVTPPSISLVLSLVIANVPPIKAVFVKTPGVSMPDAPDEKPPLDFVMEIASFAGPAVPLLGMLLLGAALSRLSMGGLPKGFWKAAVLMAVLKLIVGPIIGIAWTTGLAKQTSWVPSTDKILQLVLIIGSAAPTATAQVYLTNIFAPLGPEGCVEMSALSAILLAQYALMILTLTIVVCYTITMAI